MRWRRKDREQDLERELRSDLELEAAELEETGLSAEEARHAAQRAFGNIALVKEEVREMWGWTLWDILIQDFRYALRMLRKSPGFALTAVLTLTLGIGASTAVFTLVDSIVLEPLAYRDGGSLVVAWERVKFLGPEPTGPNPRHADLWRQRATAFSGMALLRHGASGLTLGTEHPQVVGMVTAYANLFEVLQVAPLLGRTLHPGGWRQGPRSGRHSDLFPLAKRLPWRPERNRQDGPARRHPSRSDRRSTRQLPVSKQECTPGISLQAAREQRARASDLYPRRHRAEPI